MCIGVSFKLIDKTHWHWRLILLKFIHIYYLYGFMELNKILYKILLWITRLFTSQLFQAAQLFSSLHSYPTSHIEVHFVIILKTRSLRFGNPIRSLVGFVWLRRSPSAICFDPFGTVLLIPLYNTEVSRVPFGNKRRKFRLIAHVHLSITNIGIMFDRKERYKVPTPGLNIPCHVNGPGHPNLHCSYPWP